MLARDLLSEPRQNPERGRRDDIGILWHVGTQPPPRDGREIEPLGRHRPRASGWRRLTRPCLLLPAPDQHGRLGACQVVDPDAPGQLIRPTDDGLWIGPDFYYCPPMARELGLPGMLFAEPLRVQFGFGDSVDDAESQVQRVERR